MGMKHLRLFYSKLIQERCVVGKSRMRFRLDA